MNPYETCRHTDEHIAHMSMNGECPWCGYSNAPWDVRNDANGVPLRDAPRTRQRAPRGHRVRIASTGTAWVVACDCGGMFTTRRTVREARVAQHDHWDTHR